MKVGSVEDAVTALVTYAREAAPDRVLSIEVQPGDSGQHGYQIRHQGDDFPIIGVGSMPEPSADREQTSRPKRTKPEAE